MSGVPGRSASGARALACAIVIAGAAVVAPVHAQKKPQYHTATVTFTDAPVSSSVPGEVRLTGDGAAYPWATIVTADAGTLTLDLTRSSRRLRVTLKDGLPGNGPMPAGTGIGQPGVTYIAGNYLTVFGVRTIAVGASAVREMGVSVDEIKRGYRLRYKPNVEGIGTEVCVTRYSQSSWTVSSIAAGEVCGTSGDSSGGETTRLVDQSRSSSPLLGVYVMPFSFDVHCPTCQ